MIIDICNSYFFDSYLKYDFCSTVERFPQCRSYFLNAFNQAEELLQLQEASWGTPGAKSATDLIEWKVLAACCEGCDFGRGLLWDTMSWYCWWKKSQTTT